MRAEVLLAEDLADRGRAILEAMIAAAPIPVRITPRGYKGDCEILMTYGTGHPERRPYWLQHIRTGKQGIGWDLGYWHRTDDFQMRMTLNGDHPPSYIRAEPPDRFNATGIQLRNEYDPKGPILLIGMGRKAACLHAGGPLVWERRMHAQLRAIYPKREIVFRPKRISGPMIRHCRTLVGMPIERALEGTSLVVCRHSNVAIDACIAGIPVVCEDGAAAALYGRDLRNPRAPGEEERRRFLEGVAYWNWKPSEAGEAWTYILGRLSNSI